MEGIVSFMEKTFRGIRIIERHPSSIKFRIPKAGYTAEAKDGTVSSVSLSICGFAMHIQSFMLCRCFGIFHSVYLDAIADADPHALVGPAAVGDQLTLGDIFG